MLWKTFVARERFLNEPIFHEKFLVNLYIQRQVLISWPSEKPTMTWLHVIINTDIAYGVSMQNVYGKKGAPSIGPQFMHI